MGLNNLIKRSLGSLFEKRNILFFVLLLLFYSPLQINTGKKLIGYTRIIDYTNQPLNRSIFFANTEIVLLSAFVLAAFFCMAFAFLSVASFIASLSCREKSIFQCLKCGVFNIRKILSSIILITLVQFLVISFPHPMNSTNILEDFCLFSDEGTLNRTVSQGVRIYGGPLDFKEGQLDYLATLSGYSAPFVSTPAFVEDLCTAGKEPCISMIKNHYLGLPVLQVFMLMLISIFTLFVIPELVISGSGIVRSIENSITLVKANIDDVLVIYMISVISMTLSVFAGGVFSQVMYPIIGLARILVYLAFFTLGLMFEISLITNYYLYLRSEKEINAISSSSP